MRDRTTGKAARLRVATALHHAAIRLLRGLRLEDARAGISAAQLSALSVLVFVGPMRLSALARAEQVRAPTMTRLAALMERRGLVRRREDPADRRAVRVEATPRGVRVLHEGRRRRVERLAAALGDVPAAELALLARAAALLDRLPLARTEPGGTKST